MTTTHTRQRRAPGDVAFLATPVAGAAAGLLLRNHPGWLLAAVVAAGVLVVAGWLTVTVARRIAATRQQATKATEAALEAESEGTS